MNRFSILKHDNPEITTASFFNLRPFLEAAICLMHFTYGRINCLFNPLILNFFPIGSFPSEFKIRSSLHGHKILLGLFQKQSIRFQLLIEQSDFIALIQAANESYIPFFDMSLIFFETW